MKDAELTRLLQKQAKLTAQETAREIAKKTDGQLKGFSKTIREDFSREVGTLKKDFSREVGTLKEDFSREVGALKEDFDHKLDVVLEILPDIQQKLDATFEKVGEIAVDVDVDVIKTVVKDHEHRIQKLEAHA